MLSVKTKAILRKAPTLNDLHTLTKIEAQSVLDEVTRVMRSQDPVSDPDYFTNAFIRSAMVKKLNGNRKK